MTFPGNFLRVTYSSALKKTRTKEKTNCENQKIKHKNKKLKSEELF